MSPPGVSDRAPAAPGAQLRVLGQFAGRPEPGAGDPGLLECRYDLISRLFRERVLDDRGQLVVARCPVRVACEARVGRQFGPPQDIAAEHEPLPLVLDPEKDRAVAGLERAVRGDGRMPCPGPRERLRAVVREVDGLSHPFAEGIDHRLRLPGGGDRAAQAAARAGVHRARHSETAPGRGDRATDRGMSGAASPEPGHGPRFMIAIRCSSPRSAKCSSPKD